MKSKSFSALLANPWVALMLIAGITVLVIYSNTYDEYRLFLTGSIKSKKKKRSGI